MPTSHSKTGTRRSRPVEASYSETKKRGSPDSLQNGPDRNVRRRHITSTPELMDSVDDLGPASEIARTPAVPGSSSISYAPVIALPPPSVSRAPPIDPLAPGQYSPQFISARRKLDSTSFQSELRNRVQDQISSPVASFSNWSQDRTHAANASAESFRRDIVITRRERSAADTHLAWRKLIEFMRANKDVCWWCLRKRGTGCGKISTYACCIRSTDSMKVFDNWKRNCNAIYSLGYNCYDCKGCFMPGLHPDLQPPFLQGKHL